MGDTAMRSTGWMTRIESLLARALSLAANSFADILVLRSVLGNRQEGGASSGAGQSATWTLAAITQTPGAPGNFEMSGYGAISTSAAGDQVAATLRRDGAPIGPTLDFTTDINSLFPLCIGPFVDDAPGPGPHVYDIMVTNGTGGNTVQFTTGYAVVQEVL